MLQTKESPREPVAWLFHTVKRKAMNQSRGEGRRKRRQNEVAASSHDWFEYDPSTQLVAQEVVDQLQQLSPLAREILVARVWGELTYEEIAVLVECSTATVFRTYQSALQQMAKRFAPETNHQNQTSDLSK